MVDAINRAQGRTDDSVGPTATEVKLGVLYAAYRKATTSTDVDALEANVKAFGAVFDGLGVHDLSALQLALDARGDQSPVGKGLHTRIEKRLKDLITGGTRYLVQPKDTLTALSKRTGVPVADLKAANPDLPHDGDLLVAGRTTLIVPKNPAASASNASGPVRGAKARPQQLAPDDPLRAQFAEARSAAETEQLLRGLVNKHRTDALHSSGSSNPMDRKVLNGEGAQKLIADLKQHPVSVQKAVLERLTQLANAQGLQASASIGISGWDSAAGNALYDYAQSLGVKTSWQKQVL